jgi:hypothetical protein
MSLMRRVRGVVGMALGWGTTWAGFGFALVNLAFLFTPRAVLPPEQSLSSVLLAATLLWGATRAIRRNALDGSSDGLGRARWRSASARAPADIGSRLSSGLPSPPVPRAHRLCAGRGVRCRHTAPRAPHRWFAAVSAFHSRLPAAVNGQEISSPDVTPPYWALVVPSVGGGRLCADSLAAYSEKLRAVNCRRPMFIQLRRKTRK